MNKISNDLHLNLKARYEMSPFLLNFFFTLYLFFSSKKNQLQISKPKWRPKQKKKKKKNFWFPQSG